MVDLPTLAAGALLGAMNPTAPRLWLGPPGRCDVRFEDVRAALSSGRAREVAREIRRLRSKAGVPLLLRALILTDTSDGEKLYDALIVLTGEPLPPLADFPGDRQEQARRLARQTPTSRAPRATLRRIWVRTSGRGFASSCP